MKQLIAIALTFGMATSVVAGPNDATWNPPERFMIPYTGQLTVYRLPPRQVRMACAKLLNERYLANRKVRGCARWYNNPHRCTVIIIDRPAYGTKPKAVLIHELGHCNGWSSNHEL